MGAKLILIAIVLLLSIGSCARSAEALIERRIERIERGLLSSYSDPPLKRMNLAERMEHYNVPGVSIAAINDYQVEWAKGYGVVEAGESEGVTTETLFQTASVAKMVVSVAALHYVERDVLELDGDVNRSLISWHVPDNEFMAQERVTLRRLLSHNAGVTDLRQCRAG